MEGEQKSKINRYEILGRISEVAKSSRRLRRAMDSLRFCSQGGGGQDRDEIWKKSMGRARKALDEAVAAFAELEPVPAAPWEGT